MADVWSIPTMTAPGPLRRTSSGKSWAKPGTSPRASNKSAGGRVFGRKSSGSSMTRGSRLGAGQASTVQPAGAQRRTLAAMRLPQSPCVTARTQKGSPFGGPLIIPSPQPRRRAAVACIVPDVVRTTPVGKVIGATVGLPAGDGVEMGEGNQGPAGDLYPGPALEGTLGDDRTFDRASSRQASAAQRNLECRAWRQVPGRAIRLQSTSERRDRSYAAPAEPPGRNLTRKA